jgi:dTDP-4-amino-4,6-dideoxygalactose transaminase
MQNPHMSFTSIRLLRIMLIAKDLLIIWPSKDIPAMIYYPVPLHLQKAYVDPRYKPGDFPVTEALCQSVFSLPMHTELDDEQLNYIVNSVLEFINK